MDCTHTEGERHDCRYVESRNRLIPEAEAYAHAVAGPAPLSLYARAAWGAKWSRAFHSKMNEMWSGKPSALRLLPGTQPEATA